MGYTKLTSTKRKFLGFSFSEREPGWISGSKVISPFVFFVVDTGQKTPNWGPWVNGIH